MTRTMKTVIAAGLLTASAGVNAALLFEETPGNDIDGLNFDLAVGENEFLGNGFFSRGLDGIPGQPTFDSDMFSINFDDTLALTAFDLSLTGVTEQGFVDLTIFGAIGPGPGVYSVQDGVGNSIVGSLDSIDPGDAIPITIDWADFTENSPTGQISWSWELVITADLVSIGPPPIDPPPPPIDPPPGSVPEPSVPALLGLGLLGLFMMRRRKNA